MAEEELDNHNQQDETGLTAPSSDHHDENDFQNVEFPLDDESSLPAQELDDENDTKRQKRRNCITRVFLGLILLGFIIFVTVDSLTTGYIRDGIDAFLHWVQENPAPGIFLFMLVYFVATLLFIPGSILTLGAGFVFGNAFSLGAGLLLGTLSVFLGAFSGACVAFVIARYLLRGYMLRLTKKYALFEALDAALKEKGFRIMALLRLSPIIPYNIVNYLAGVTAISFRDYAFSMIFIIPGTAFYIFLGASAGSLADSANSGEDLTVTIAVIIVGVVLGLAAILITSYYAKKELSRVLRERSSNASEPEVDEEAVMEVAGQIEDPISDPNQAELN
jgi:uncharacterized membrane protein YdjX (TVP38/TMEM64 family)